MKCPERYNVIQANIHKYIYNEDGQTIKYGHILAESQQFEECYEEECAAWDKEKNICRKVGN